jgi:hypothetical protein
LFGAVASDATAWRAVAALDSLEMLDRVRAARAAARAFVWRQPGAAPERVILDIDATLVTAHSEKEQAAGTYKGGFGFHPLLCYEAATGDALAGLLRPGNAAAHTADDHVEVLCLANQQLPAAARGAGVLVRADSGGASKQFLAVVRDFGFRFSVSLDLSEPVRAAILALDEAAWQPALAGQSTSLRDVGEAAVAELCLDLAAAGWPAGTRAICRRERPHPGAQLSFTDAHGYRFQVLITDQQGRRIARLEQLHRARADIEDRIRAAKDSGLRNLPFHAFTPNAAWLELVLMAQDLTAWTQRLCLAGTALARSEPKRLRYRLLHIAARITRHARRLRLHLPRDWAWRDQLLLGFQRLAALPAPSG